MGKEKKKHISLDFKKIKWNWRALVKEAESWNDGQTVNCQAVARRCEVHRSSDTDKLAGNGGQIVQAVLTHAGVDVTRFLSGKGQRRQESLAADDQLNGQDQEYKFHPTPNCRLCKAKKSSSIKMVFS